MEECVEFLIRPFRLKDQNACRELILSGLAGHFGSLDLSLNEDLDAIETSYLSAGNIFVVAENNLKVIGTGALIFETDIEARIVRLSVLPNARRSGVGEAIVQDLIRSAKEAGSASINVETNHEWQPARRLYEKIGFMMTGFDEESAHYKLDL